MVSLFLNLIGNQRHSLALLIAKPSLDKGFFAERNRRSAKKYDKFVSSCLDNFVPAQNCGNSLLSFERLLQDSSYEQRYRQNLWI
jgi:hypothetical protein